jgi:hypothetical protein
LGSPDGRREWAKERIADALERYVVQREQYYADPRLLDKLLKKDALLWVLRGARTIDDWTLLALSAHESSSEETVWGNTWQHILTSLAVNAVGAGDLLVDRDGVLWVIELKSQTNTLNSASRAQTLKVLKAKVEQHDRVRTPGRRGVKAMIGVIRGPDEDRWINHRARSREDADIDGYGYQLMVGATFREWLTGFANPVELLDEQGLLDRIPLARAACLARLNIEVRERLSAEGLPEDVWGIFRGLT